MDVHLLVYDLSRGLAREMSRGLLGLQLDAIYHTSIQLNGREYVYDGGIVAITPGSSHLGQPLDKIHLGTTNLPLDIIEEYLDSLRTIFTVESYDLFRHNCNNFSDSFANFLVGKGIPGHIVNMPQAVLDSPMGRMLVPQLTQGVNAGRSNGSIFGLEQSSQVSSTGTRSPRVVLVSKLDELMRVLDSAKDSCAIVFFTSATCAPCNMMYSLYDQLAEEFGNQATFIKVDISQPQSMSISQHFSVRATPTFITMLKGKEENRWSGANKAALQSKIQLLVQMAHPSHPHERLRLPTFLDPNSGPVLYSKVPPMAKLEARMGHVAKKPQIQKLKSFLEARSNLGPRDAVLPDLEHLSGFIRESVSQLAPEVLFAVIDLFRCALSDPRVSAYSSEEAEHKTIKSVLNLVNSSESCPYALRLVTIQMACNMFSTPLFVHEVLQHASLRSALVQLVTSSFLDDAHNNIRVAASSLLFNIALASRRARDGDSSGGLPEEDQVESAAALVEAIAQEDKSVEALQGMLTALGHLFFGVGLDGELADLLRALGAQEIILAKIKLFPNERLITEVGQELLGRGLRKP
ncbi:thioredoxin [Metarhizium album ARSEF 1941]|uniref:Thioredoxin n=1 Tax=Metarhizium album (strain ARSEF 1941) TaxID=1081103 RepID=A0A0B2X4X4_METAS|nr:thioredoxin [Metarhizium album ARSEF 1941]KHO00346.1 thioredoxin [Metarhizium album ARSEF 1941]